MAMIVFQTSLMFKANFLCYGSKALHGGFSFWNVGLNHLNYEAVHFNYGTLVLTSSFWCLGNFPGTIFSLKFNHIAEKER